MSATVTLPDGRTAQMIPADEAGEYVLSAAEGLIRHLALAGYLTSRQATAAEEMARLYGIGGGASPWRRSGGGHRDEAEIAAARSRFADLMAHAPQRTRWPLTVLAMGEWVTTGQPIPLWQEGLTAIADFLRLAEDRP